MRSNASVSVRAAEKASHFSITTVQHQTEASINPIITALTTGCAWRNSPRNEKSLDVIVRQNHNWVQQRFRITRPLPRVHAKRLPRRMSKVRIPRQKDGKDCSSASTQ